MTVGDRVIEESHDIGLFPQYVWADRLRAAGFAEVDELDASETGWGERVAFVAHLGGS